MGEIQSETLLIENLVESPYQGRILGDKKTMRQEVKIRLQELANSINTSGLLQPISVRKVGEYYEIIDGHRRVEAHKILGLKTIPSIIVEKSDKEIQVMSVVANLQRSNLNSIEKAVAFEKILKSKAFKTRKELSLAIGKDETYIGDILNLLNLDERIIADIAKNNTTNDVRLLRIIRKAEKVDESGRSVKQFEVYRKFKKDKLSRSEVSALIKKLEAEELQSSDQDVVNTKKTKPIANKAGFSISVQDNAFSIVFKENLSSELQEKIQKFLEQKLKENLVAIKAVSKTVE